MQGFIEVNNGRLYVESAGSGPAVVFIHGFSLNSSMWDDQFSQFALHYNAIRYDVRGFGKSSVPQGLYDHAEDLSQLLAELNVAKTSLVGLSMGGAIALHFAFAYPEKAVALVLADSSIGTIQPSSEVVSIGSKNRGEEDYQSNYINKLKKLWLSDDIFKPAFEHAEIKKRIVRMVEDYSGYHWVHENPVAYLDRGYFNRLRQITSPTLVIVGARDVQKHSNVADIIATTVANARKVVIPGVGHMSNMEDPIFFNQVVMAFLNENRAQ